MNDKKYSLEVLIKLQRYSWYFVLCYFATASLVYLFQIPIPFAIGFYGVLIVLLITLIKIIVIAEKFRKIHLIRFMILSYSLIVILIITIIIRLL